MCHQGQASVQEGTPKPPCDQAVAVAVVPKRVRRDKLWIIHGALYDLEEFVNRHPGGKETILLGQGRDCTALFESYHAFAKSHRQVLETYRFSNKPQQETATATASQEDYFYLVIKERAIAALKGKGIHPVTHRGATPARALYYAFISCCCVMAGYWHLQVRPSFLDLLLSDRHGSTTGTCPDVSHSLFFVTITYKGKLGGFLFLCDFRMAHGSLGSRCRTLGSQQDAMDQ
jgi:hypothetical protein